MILDTSELRSANRLALPSSDSYIFRLGMALYGFAWISNFMIEIITQLDPRASNEELEKLTSGQIFNRFLRSVEEWSGSDISVPSKSVAEEFGQLNSERNDIVHSTPITNSLEEQILLRRDDSKGKYLEITSEFMDGFIERLSLVSDSLYQIREIVEAES